MAMSRKDYVNLATSMGLALRYDYPTEEEYEAAQRMTVTVADALNSANTNFDRERFLAFVNEVMEGLRDADGRRVKGAA